MRHTLARLLATEQKGQAVLMSAALIKRVASGDESAFATLYDTTCELIYGLLLQLLGNAETAEQILAATYQEVWEQAVTYDDEHEKPMTWLITMAHGNAIARLRANNQEQGRQTCRPVTAGCAMPTDSETDGIISDKQRVIRSAFAALSPAQQQVIELAYFSGLRQTEIAAHLNLPLRSVQMEMRAGMMRLREAFESHELYQELYSVNNAPADIKNSRPHIFERYF